MTVKIERSCILEKGSIILEMAMVNSHIGVDCLEYSRTLIGNIVNKLRHS